MVRDPICQMDVDENKAMSSYYRGKRFYFCSTVCKEQFDEQHPVYPTHCSECMKDCDIKETVWKIKHKDVIYAFCSEKCKDDFESKNFGGVIY